MPAETDFIEAAKNRDAVTVRSMLDADAQLVNVSGDHDKTALHWAAEKDDIDTAMMLLAEGADIEARTSWGATAFEWAAVMGSDRVADLLLENGTSGFNLVTAAALGKLDDVKNFIQTDKEKVSDALHSAARNGRTETVAYLLGQGGDIDAKGFFGATGLHWAAINGHSETVEFLIKNKAATYIKDAEFNATPEDWAIEGGFHSIAEMLRGVA